MPQNMGQSPLSLWQNQMQQNWQSPVFNGGMQGGGGGSPGGGVTPAVMAPDQSQPFALQNVVGMDNTMPWGTRK